MPARFPDQGLCLTAGGLALVTDGNGEINDRGAGGLYQRDLRIVSQMHFLVAGQAPLKLSRSRTGASTDRLIYGYWSEAADPAAVIVRERTLDTGYEERVTVQCFRKPVRVRIEVHLVPDNSPVYHLDQARAGNGSVAESTLWAEGASVSGTAVSAEVGVAPGQSAEFSWGLDLRALPVRSRPATQIQSTSHRTQRALDNAAWDLEALTVTEPASGRCFVAAGAPHFLAVFGRDSLCASLLAMVADPLRAMDTLELLARHQGREHDPATLESPGAILHELRIGEMGVFGLEPGVAYYGSIDATPLFVLTLAESLRWGAPLVRVRELLPAARAAVEWCRRHVDGFGFLQSVPHDRGLGNQSWKDSGDAVVRPDGSVATGRYSPVEVQGYVYEALVGLAELESVAGSMARAAELRTEATEFAGRFAHHFVLEDHPALVASALDASGKPIPVRASNVGHLLATRLIDNDLAARLADRLMSPEEFSGWGVRTLAASEVAYNPLGYHVGSVWPHDNAMLLRGLALRGFDSHTHRLAGALVDLAAAEEFQLPELLGGLDRGRFGNAVPYPASARPQAWAAAVPYQIVTALLGLAPVAHRNLVRLRPILDSDQRLVVEDLRLGDRVLTIEARGDQASLTGDTEGLTIEIG